MKQKLILNFNVARRRKISCMFIRDNNNVATARASAFHAFLLPVQEIDLIEILPVLNPVSRCKFFDCLLGIKRDSHHWGIDGIDPAT